MLLQGPPRVSPRIGLLLDLRLGQAPYRSQSEIDDLHGFRRHAVAILVMVDPAQVQAKGVEILLLILLVGGRNL